MQRVVFLLIERMGHDTNRVNKRTGQYENLRATESLTGISRTALSHIKAGITQFPDEATCQRLALALNELNPPLRNPETGEEIRPTWLELIEMNTSAQPQKGEQKAPASISSEVEKMVAKEVANQLKAFADALVAGRAASL